MPVFSTFIPIPSPLKSKSTPFELKERLDWGEPALTIVDVRNRSAFNASHITGAISIPANELISRATQSLEYARDIYVYGDTDEESSSAAAKLRDAGYQKVAELIGGLPAWHAARGTVEGPATAIA